MAPNATNIGIVCMIAEEIAREPKTMLITNNTEEKSSQKNVSQMASFLTQDKIKIA